LGGVVLICWLFGHPVVMSGLISKAADVYHDYAENRI
jgi:hypothetical protein